MASPTPVRRPPFRWNGVVSCWFAISALALWASRAELVTSLDLIFIMNMAPLILVLIGLVAGLTGLRHPRGRGWSIAGVALNGLYLLGGLVAWLAMILQTTGLRFWSR